MSMPVEQQVFGLEVAIYDFQRMEIVESEGDFGGVELCDWIREALKRFYVSLPPRTSYNMG